MDPIIAKHLESTPGVCGGRPRITGTRTRVQDIVNWHERLGYSPDEIVWRYPQLTLADVYAALAYYHDHRDEIERHIQEGEELATSLQRQIPSKLLQKLAAPDAGADSLPPG
ncbi:MAG TPA: DUF433 domain-containing protein [Candidatus Tectomicrobia bacterium]